MKSIPQFIAALLPRFWTNWITLLGTVLATVSGSIIVFSLAIMAVAGEANQYAMALAVLVMPGLFIFGLVLIALGFIYESHRKKGRRDLGPVDQAFRQAFKLAVEDRRTRGMIIFVSIISLLNIIIIAGVGHTALGYMDTPQFCGTLCHHVMQPEYDSYLESPHSRVKCVQCHIGPGADWAVKAKIDGLRQVWGVMTGSYSRPIPSPVHALRPARDTCEQCHWPAKFHGNRVSFAVHFEDDEENTPSITALMLRIGGKAPKTGEFHGIHWHVSPHMEVRFEALDDKREKVGKVQVYKDGELETEYVPPKYDDSEVREVRTMDCVDCHNRPTHVYDQTPQLAVDRAFFSGMIDRTVPFMHEAAVTTLKAAGSSVERDKAETHFATALADFYKKHYPDQVPDDEILAKAAAGLSALYHLNIYPALNLTWETHPNHLGHLGEEQDKRGCFRCHNDEHESKDGKAISMDCEVCHEFLEEEVTPDELPDNLRALLPEF
jgi:hypothetical protein